MDDQHRDQVEIAKSDLRRELQRLTDLFNEHGLPEHGEQTKLLLAQLEALDSGPIKD